MKKRELLLLQTVKMNNVFDFIYIQSINAFLENRYIIPTITNFYSQSSPFFKIIHHISLCQQIVLLIFNKHLFSCSTITSFHDNKLFQHLPFRNNLYHLLISSKINFLLLVMTHFLVMLTHNSSLSWAFALVYLDARLWDCYKTAW